MRVLSTLVIAAVIAVVSVCLLLGRTDAVATVSTANAAALVNTAVVARQTVLVLGGGASDFTVLSTDAGKDHSMTVKARVKTWSLLGQIQGKRVVQARPENTILVTAKVIKTAAGPRISQYSWDFAPGSEP